MDGWLFINKHYWRRWPSFWQTPTAAAATADDHGRASRVESRLDQSRLDGLYKSQLDSHWDSIYYRKYTTGLRQHHHRTWESFESPERSFCSILTQDFIGDLHWSWWRRPRVRNVLQKSLEFDLLNSGGGGGEWGRIDRSIVFNINGHTHDG